MTNNLSHLQTESFVFLSLCCILNSITASQCGDHTEQPCQMACHTEHFNPEQSRKRNAMEVLQLRAQLSRKKASLHHSLNSYQKKVVRGLAVGVVMTTCPNRTTQYQFKIRKYISPCNTSSIKRTAGRNGSILTTDNMSSPPLHSVFAKFLHLPLKFPPSAKYESSTCHISQDLGKWWLHEGQNDTATLPPSGDIK